MQWTSAPNIGEAPLPQRARGYWKARFSAAREELEKLLEEEGTAVFFREICNGAIDLYVRDSPTLRELASSSGVVYFDDMIQITEAEKEQNWMGIFILKAQIRIMDVTPVPHRSIWYVSLAHLFASALLTYGDFFKTLRPVFTLP